MTHERAIPWGVSDTNTTLEAVYKKANELISLPAKESNYPEDQRDFRLNAAQLDNAATFFEELCVSPSTISYLSVLTCADPSLGSTLVCHRS